MVSQPAMRTVLRTCDMLCDMYAKSSLHRDNPVVSDGKKDRNKIRIICESTMRE